MSFPAPKRWRAVVLALVIFVSGAVAGAALTLATVQHTAQSAFRKPGLSPKRLAARVRSRLHLDAQQETVVARIFADRQAAWIGIRHGIRPQLDAELEGLRRDVSAVLTPRQAEQWNRWFERKRGRWLPGAAGRR